MQMGFRRCCHTIFCAILVAANCLGNPKDTIRYSRDIQPIFAEHCLQCHGPDAAHREADLRLDVEASVKESAIVAGKPGQSALIERVTSEDPDLQMPPPSSGVRLADTEVRLLRQWITDGATYEQHWAFRAIDSSVAAPQPAGWRHLGAIDRFVNARLEQKGIEPAAPATKQQLIRRATFDLTGLPPTWRETQDFIADESGNAFEKVVDRLLDSNAYGERWGRHWLDLARYADTHGGAAIGFTRFPFSYTYRDYVIESFRRHVPFDQFILEQLAADQLQLNDGDPRLAGLGFLTVGMQFRNPHNVVDDQIDVVTRGLMGLTVSCARCHDHKFDAVTTKDYYSMYAVFAASENPPELPVIGEAPADEFHDYQEQLEQLSISYDDMARDQSAVMRGRLRMQVGLYLREIAKGAAEPDLASADVFSYRTDDLRPLVLHRWQRYIRDMPKNDPVFGPWVKLSQWSATQRTPTSSSSEARISESTAEATNLPAASAEEALSSEPALDFAAYCARLISEMREENGDLPTDLNRVAVESPRWNPRVLSALERKRAKSMLDVADAYGELFGEVHVEWLRSIVDASLEAKPETQPIPDEDPKHTVINSAVNRQLRRHLMGRNSPTSMTDELASRLLNRPIKDNLNGRRGAIHGLNLNSPGSPPRAMALVEREVNDPFFVFVRGNPRQRGDVVLPRFLSALGGSDDRPFEDGKRRLRLAQAVIGSENPLTRRVIVNWVWQHHFGQGIVRTPDDFGTRGQPPTHPKLLDYLATKLLEDNWSIKKLHKRIMLSQVYRQSSVERADARVVDPDNRLLWRMPRQRLNFESMRDAMLFVSDELVTERNGKLVGGRPFELSASPAVPRRTVYAFVNRDIVNPMMSTFDAANPNACTAKRPLTTVPQQTLFALNSDFIQDRAVAFVTAATNAATLEADVTLDMALVRELYRRAYSREPDADEMKAAISFVEADAVGQGGVEKKERWQRLAHALLASNEFVFLD